MSQAWLFSVAPYAAVGLMAVGVLGRLAVPRDAVVRAAEAERFHGLFGRSRSWMLALSVILLGYAGVLFLSGQVLRWNENPTRRMLLEVTAIACAGLVVTGLVGNLWQRRRGTAAAVRAVDAMFLTTLFTWLLSGVAMALLHRWVSSWSMTTVVPYVHSLFRLAPEAYRIVDLPFLLRLHLLSAFVLLASWPCTSAGIFLTGTATRKKTEALA